MWFAKPFRGDSLPEKTLAITFDDGPGPETLKIAEYLAEKNIPAAFFLVGKHCREFPEAADRLRQWGHSTEDHSVNHFHLTNSHSSVAGLVNEATGTGFFRPPYGAWSPRLAHLFNSHEQTREMTGPVNWNIGGSDFRFWREEKEASECSRYYLNAIRSRKKQNGIALFHDRDADNTQKLTGPNLILDLLQIVIPKLQHEEFRFVPLRNVPELQRAASM